MHLTNSSHQCRHKVGLAVIVGAAEDESLPPRRVDLSGARFPRLILALLSLEELFQTIAASIRRADIAEKNCFEHHNNITSMALKSSEAEAQKRNKTKSQ